MKDLKQFLYLFIHRITGFMYLGQTTRDLDFYNGSSDVWTKHIEEHDDDFKLQPPTILLEQKYEAKRGKKKTHLL